MLPKDIRRALSLTSAALGLIGMTAVVVGLVIALRGEPVSVFVAGVVGYAIKSLKDLGQWVLDFNARTVTPTDEEPPPLH